MASDPPCHLMRRDRDLGCCAQVVLTCDIPCLQHLQSARRAAHKRRNVMEGMEDANLMCRDMDNCVRNGTILVSKALSSETAHGFLLLCRTNSKLVAQLG
jgi:hypothetical protein